MQLLKLCRDNVLGMRIHWCGCECVDWGWGLHVLVGDMVERIRIYDPPTQQPWSTACSWTLASCSPVFHIRACPPSGIVELTKIRKQVRKKQYFSGSSTATVGPAVLPKPAREGENLSHTTHSLQPVACHWPLWFYHSQLCARWWTAWRPTATLPTPCRATQRPPPPCSPPPTPPPPCCPPPKGSATASRFQTSSQKFPLSTCTSQSYPPWVCSSSGQSWDPIRIPTHSLSCSLHWTSRSFPWTGQQPRCPPPTCPVASPTTPSRACTVHSPIPSSPSIKQMFIQKIVFQLICWLCSLSFARTSCFSQVVSGLNLKIAFSTSKWGGYTPTCSLECCQVSFSSVPQ